MKVEILHDGKQIGCANLDAGDPSMGVASGLFEPSSIYDAEFHAGEIDGEENSREPTPSFAARSEAHGFIECLAVFIQDYDQSLQERHVTLLGIPHPVYEEIFSQDPEFKTYWGRE